MKSEKEIEDKLEHINTDLKAMEEDGVSGVNYVMLRGEQLILEWILRGIGERSPGGERND